MKIKTERCWCGRFMAPGGAWSAQGGQSGKCSRCTILADARTGWSANGYARSWNR